MLAVCPPSTTSLAYIAYGHRIRASHTRNAQLAWATLPSSFAWRRNNLAAQGCNFS